MGNWSKYTREEREEVAKVTGKLRCVIVDVEEAVSKSGNNMIVSPSDNMIDELNNNGYLGRYMGCNVMKLQNAYRDGTTEPVLAVDWIYILPAGMSADARNLKVVNEGGVNAFESQNIDDLVYEIRLDQAFGAGFVTGKLPTIGAYKIG